MSFRVRLIKSPLKGRRMLFYFLSIQSDAHRVPVSAGAQQLILHHEDRAGTALGSGSQWAAWDLGFWGFVTSPCWFWSPSHIAQNETMNDSFFWKRVVLVIHIWLRLLSGTPFKIMSSFQAKSCHCRWHQIFLRLLLTDTDSDFVKDSVGSRVKEALLV